MDQHNIEGNGFRVYLRGTIVYVQDLIEGAATSFDTYTLPRSLGRPQGGRAIRGRLAAIRANAVAGPALGGRLDHLGSQAAVEWLDFATALTTGGENEHPEEVSRLMPTLRELRRAACPNTWDQFQAGEFDQLMLAATALAWHGGLADEETLVEWLANHGRDSTSARTLIHLARKKHVYRAVAGSCVPTYALMARDEPPAPVGLVRRAPSDGNSSLAKLFADDDETLL